VNASLIGWMKTAEQVMLWTGLVFGTGPDTLPRIRPINRVRPKVLHHQRYLSADALPVLARAAFARPKRRLTLRRYFVEESEKRATEKILRWMMSPASRLLSVLSMLKGNRGPRKKANAKERRLLDAVGGRRPSEVYSLLTQGVDPNARDFRTNDIYSENGLRPGKAEGILREIPNLGYTVNWERKNPPEEYDSTIFDYEAEDLALANAGVV